ncbi:hypothetical protein [Microcoleus vaginatus]|uniref:hypothetical protein n=1 Tax=Microcoleus vaginatus TaxID=119532 RepID=UPI001689E593
MLVRNLRLIEERKKEEGRRKKEEGRRKKEEGRRKKEEGRRKREEGRGKKEEGRRNLQLTFSAIKNVLIVLAVAIEGRSLKKKKLYRKVDDRKHKLRNF